MEASRLGYRIRSYRKLKGFTQQGLADELGVSVSVLGALERGMRDPDDKLIHRIAEVLTIPYEELCQTVESGK